MAITDNFLPPIPKMLFPEGRVKFRVQDLLKGKVANERKLVQLFSWDVHGIYGHD